MKILFVSQYITPSYFYMLKRAFPEDAEFVLHAGNRFECGANVQFIESPRHNSTSLLSRIKCWFAYWWHLKRWVHNNRSSQFDLIIATSNPPVNAFIWYFVLKKIYQCKFIYVNWDIYPQIIDETYHHRIVHIICNIWHKLNDLVYPQIDQMVTIGDCVSESIQGKLKNKIDIEVISIPTNIDVIKPILKSENRFSVEQDLVDKFVVLYSGKMGLGHNIELILKASEMISEKDIVFVFIGHGPGYDIVESYIKEHANANIRVFPLQTQEIFPYSIACGDIGIVSQEQKLAHLFMPSKTYDMMAAGMAIVGIGSTKDDLHELITKEKVGCCLKENTPKELADVILRLYRDSDELDTYKKNARYVAMSNYSETIISEKYMLLIKKNLGSEIYEAQ